jgi:hypothetical protein
MPISVKKPHPALKHGGFSATSILPGENAAEFENLHKKLIAELAPNGAFEDDIVATMARLLWRKQNLATFRIAALVQGRCQQITHELVPSKYSDGLEEAIQAAKDQARKEFGATFDLVEIGDTATIDGLMNDLAVQDRLDAMLDKCLKRLLFLRGLKSLSATPSSAPKPLGEIDVAARQKRGQVPSRGDTIESCIPAKT